MAEDDEHLYGYDEFDDDGFEDYEETTVHPVGNLAIVVGVVLSFVTMFVIMPFMVYRTKRQRKRAKVQKELGMLQLKSDKTADGSYYFIRNDAEDSPEEDPLASPFRKIRATCRTVLKLDRESNRILTYALPFTVSAFVSSILESAVLAIVGHFVGTKQLAAIAITNILLELVEDFLQGPLNATTTLCAHASASGNNFLAGQYVQLSLVFYWCLQAPLLVMWYILTDNMILWLEWGDEEEARFAIDYIRIAIWAVVLDCVQTAFVNLLEVTGHEYYTTFMGIFHELMHVIILAILILVGIQLNVQVVALVSVVCSGFFLALTVGLAFWVGWLKPFAKGIFRNFSLRNRNAVTIMAKTATPLCFGSILGNAEWAILTVFASYMGHAEVAAWAILGSIWGIFESTTEGIGDAAEIRVAYHLGNNHPSKAKLSAYKSLFLGVSIDSIVTIVMFLLMDKIPKWFTADETLQEMIGECLPLIGIGNIVMTFGMICWYMIGAQGRYKLGTWLNFAMSWGITVPLAAVSVYAWNLDLQALTFSVLLGYVGVGATLSYLVLTSDWAYYAKKIVRRNAEEEDDDEEEPGGEKDGPDESDNIFLLPDDKDEELYAALQGHRSRTARAVATGNLKLLTASPGPLGFDIDELPHRKGPIITTVHPTSPFQGMVFPGDSLLSIDGTSVLSFSMERIHKLMEQNEDQDRQITIMTATPFHYQEEGTSKVLLTGTVPDIPDFEEEETNFPHWWEGEGEHDLV